MTKKETGLGVDPPLGQQACNVLRSLLRHGQWFFDENGRGGQLCAYLIVAVCVRENDSHIMVGKVLMPIK